MPNARKNACRYSAAITMTNTAVSAPFSQMKSIMNSGSRTPVSAEEVTVRFVSGTSSSTNSARSQFDGRAMRRAEENASRLVSNTPMRRPVFPACMTTTRAHISKRAPRASTSAATSKNTHASGFANRVVMFVSAK